MNKPKTRKSIIKRFKITKNGKVIYRLRGQNHLLAKKSGKFRRKRHTNKVLNSKDAKRIIKALYF